MKTFRDLVEMSYPTREPYNSKNHSFEDDFYSHHKEKIKLIANLKPKLRLYKNLDFYFLTDQNDSYIAGVSGIVSKMRLEQGKKVTVMEIRQGHSTEKGKYIILLKALIEYELDVVVSEILLSNAAINFWKKVQKGGPFNLVTHPNGTKNIEKYDKELDYFQSEYRLGITKVPNLFEDTLKRVNEMQYDDEKSITYLYSDINK